MAGFDIYGVLVIESVGLLMLAMGCICLFIQLRRQCRILDQVRKEVRMIRAGQENNTVSLSDIHGIISAYGWIASIKADGRIEIV